MLWSAVSLCMALSGTDQVAAAQDAAVWQIAQRSIATILRNGLPCGQAALIGKSGLFLAGDTGLIDPSVEARLSDGRRIRLDWKAMDRATQTVLLQAEDWTPDMGIVVTVRPPGQPLSKTPVLVVLPGGPVRGELVSENRLGVLSNSAKRMFPLGEVRFESREQSLAGALVFDQEGHLAGLLSATLSDSSNQGSRIVKVPVPAGLGGGASQLDSSPRAQAKSLSFGPADPTIGYTVSSEVLRRVVAGFLSPTHKVMHPAIGAFCKDAPTPGALVQQVTSGSPADKGGLEPGDIIVKMGDKPIRNQFDFARFVDTKDVGDTITVVVLRDLVPKTLTISVGTVEKS